MSKFKIGQRVKVFPYWDRDYSVGGVIISEADKYGVYQVELDGGSKSLCSEGSMYVCVDY